MRYSTGALAAGRIVSPADSAKRFNFDRAFFIEYTELGSYRPIVFKLTRLYPATLCPEDVSLTLRLVYKSTNHLGGFISLTQRYNPCAYKRSVR